MVCGLLVLFAGSRKSIFRGFYSPGSFFRWLDFLHHCSRVFSRGGGVLVSWLWLPALCGVFVSIGWSLAGSPGWDPEVRAIRGHRVSSSSPYYCLIAQRRSHEWQLNISCLIGYECDRKWVDLRVLICCRPGKTLNSTRVVICCTAVSGFCYAKLVVYWLSFACQGSLVVLGAYVIFFYWGRVRPGAFSLVHLLTQYASPWWAFSPRSCCWPGVVQNSPNLGLVK